VSAGGRYGGGSLRISAAAAHLQKTLDAQSSWVVGVAFYVSGLPATRQHILHWIDGATPKVNVQLNPDGTLQFYASATVSALSASSQVLTAGVWHYIEWLYTISTAICAAQCVLKVDGATWIDQASGTNTRGGGINSTANSLTVGAGIAAGGIPAYAYDDLYVADRTGSVVSTFLGDSRIEATSPTVDGTNLTWSGFNDEHPQWGLDGKMMYWLSNKQGLKNLSRGGQTDVFAMFFDPKAWDRFTLSKEDFDLKLEMEKKDTTKKPASPLTFNLKNLEDRTQRLTSTSTMLSGAHIRILADRGRGRR